MAQSVDAAFAEFHKDIVNLDASRSDKAKSSRDWLWEQLHKLDEKDDLDFPYEYQARNLDYGSFVRKTKIRELDDIDMMFCLVADGAYYRKESSVYYINTSNSGERLKKLSDENILNSRKVVNKLKNALSEIEHYKSADIHRRGEAATLSLQSYEWVFDIVPCFYTDTGLYLIPDGNGNWKATDPRIDQSNVSDSNKNYDGKLLQLIRTLKYWNRENSSVTMGSYLFEQFVINFVKNKTSVSTHIDFDIRDFFNYLSSNIYYSVNDPKGIQGDLNTLTYSERGSISEEAEWSFNKSKEAIKAELDEKDQEIAINKWREIFGDKYPEYE